MNALTESDLSLAIQLTLKMVSQHDVPTREDIEVNSRVILEMLKAQGRAGDLVLEEVIREVESRCDVYVPSGTSLVDLRGHVAWLANRRAEIDWKFWERYRRWLEDFRHIEPWAVRRLDETTSEILKNLEDPKRIATWDRRGMVVGQVQSGKTANYIGMACKAADAGYRLIVVLAGVHNSLRAQTQLRIDEGFLGFDTQRRMLDGRTELMGVGAMPGAVIHPVHTLTNSSENGDFKLTVAKSAHVMVGGTDPIILVVKKNSAILENLTKWATFLREKQDPTTGRSIVKDVPILVIDDEADNASINTGRAAESRRPHDRDVTRINGLIRKLLNSFEQSAYIGYTATPFANILIFKGTENIEFGEDLFPRSFIVRLQTPSNHFGPLRVFGSKEDPVAGVEATPGLPIVRPVGDYGEWVRDRHRSTWSCGPLPGSLKEALRSFILVGAVRAARGQEPAHNSMLIHVTQYNAVQDQVAEQVAAELEYLQQRLKRGDGASPHQVRAELRELWERDFIPTSAQIDGYGDAMPEWHDIDQGLFSAASKVELRKINGTAKDALEYVEHPEGLSLIAIGGNKLSRGLTLEGLSVSYYLRASRMYDTLMQMGRWFGYRPGYEDLCRLYTTTELREWYRDITQANEELLRLFDEMYQAGQTPEHFGLRIKTHPDGLMVTARAKMQDGEVMKVSLAGTIAETLVFDIRSEIVEQNLAATERLLRALGPPARRSSTGSVVWDISVPDPVLEFVDDYVPHERSRKADRNTLRRYIAGRNADGELNEWTVALISVEDAVNHAVISGQQVGLVQRKIEDPEAIAENRYSVGRLINPTDEYIDFNETDRARALEVTQDRWRLNPGKSKRQEPPTVPAGAVIRGLRRATRGLLLIYPLDHGVDPQGRMGDRPIVAHAISFPGSRTAGGDDYVVNNVYQEQELEFE